MATITAHIMQAASQGGRRVWRKTPSDVTKYEINWAAMLEDGETITGTPTWTLDSGITKDIQANTTTTTQILLSGGTDGTSYSVECAIVTTPGAFTFRRGFTIKVRQPV